MAHQTDTPYLTSQITETGTDFQIKFVQQSRPHRCIVDAFRDGDGIQLRQAVILVHHKLQAQRFQSVTQHFMVARMTGPAIFQTFFSH